MTIFKENIANLTKPKAIIYDWDNTLVDSWPLIQRSLDKTLISMNKKPWGLEKVKANVHKSMRESFPALFGDKWQEAGELYKQNYYDIHLDIDFLPNSKKLINYVSQIGILQFVVSNKVGVTLRKECAKLNVEDLFFSIIGAHDSNNDKPSKDPVELAISGSDIDLKKDEIWFIGDTISDVECALNSNCTPIIYSSNKSQISPSISQEVVNSNNIAIYYDHDNLINHLNKISN